MNNIMELMNAAERKHKSLRNKCGLIYDGDSVLMDIMDDADVEPDEFLEICKIYRNSYDRPAVAMMFYTITGVEFEDFLKRCVNEMTVEE